MDKKIKDYLHLYLGCEAIITDVRNDAPDEHWAAIGNRITIDTSFLHYISEGWISVKPILRKLSDMTEQENKELKKIKHSDVFIIKNAEITQWLLSKHFDLFNLIESGLAIDATTLKK